MSKYDSLARYLAELADDSVTLSFGQINDMLPGGLPQSAYDHRPWWANRNDGRGSQSTGWQSVGWESSDVDMERERVTFVRVIKHRQDVTDVPYIKPLTIEEAKLGLAVKFGVAVSAIGITITA